MQGLWKNIFSQSGQHAHPASLGSCSLGRLRSHQHTILTRVPTYVWVMLRWIAGSVLIRESSTPRAAAVVAAPILKLCPANFDASKPVFDSASLTLLTNCSRDKGRPSLNWKKGPGWLPRIAKYAATVDTGHSLFPVFPKNIDTPHRNGSVLDAFFS